MLDGVVERDRQPLGDAGRDRPVDERQAQALGEGRADLAAAGPVGRGQRDDGHGRVASRTMPVPAPSPIPSPRPSSRRSPPSTRSCAARSGAWIARELRPHAAEWERARHFPDEVFGKLAAQGLLGLKYPAAYGGQGGGELHDAVLVQELARCGSGGLAAGIGAHIGIATPPIFKFGTEDQKQRYLVPAIAGEKIAALAITEPDAGSDVAVASARAPSASTAAGSSTARRCSSPTACARTSTSPRSRRPRRAATTASASCSSTGSRGYGDADREARLARVRHRADRARRRLRARRQPARPRARGLRADHGQLPVGAAGHGARRGGGDGGGARAHAGLHARARRLRPADRPPPGRPPPPRGDRDDDRGQPGASPSTRCARTWRAATPCAR